MKLAERHTRKPAVLQVSPDKRGARMTVTVMTIKLYAPWVHSLKEKRKIVKGLCEKLRHKFHVSVIESDAQDIHQTIVVSALSHRPRRGGRQYRRGNPRLYRAQRRRRDCGHPGGKKVAAAAKQHIITGSAGCPFCVKTGYFTIYTAEPHFNPAALASSVSRWISSLKFLSTRT